MFDILLLAIPAALILGIAVAVLVLRAAARRARRAPPQRRDAAAAASPGQTARPRSLPAPPRRPERVVVPAPAPRTAGSIAARGEGDFGDTQPQERSAPRARPPRPADAGQAAASAPSIRAPAAPPIGAAPRAVCAAPAAPTVPAAALPPAVLVVDDSAVVRAKLKKTLQAQGWSVVAAGDGMQALELLGAQRFKLLISDLEMPRMDGRELIARLGASPGAVGLPVIAITGHDRPEAAASLGPNVRAVLRKPWGDAELNDTLAALWPTGAQAAAAVH